MLKTKNSTEIIALEDIKVNLHVSFKSAYLRVTVSKLSIAY